MERGREQSKEQGTVKWFSEEKGYGFIQSGKKEFFVHRSEIEDMERALEKGQSVEFEIGDSPKGPVARNVRTV